MALGGHFGGARIGGMGGRSFAGSHAFAEARTHVTVNNHVGDRGRFRGRRGYWGGGFWGGGLYGYDSCYPYLGVYPYCEY